MSNLRRSELRRTDNHRPHRVQETHDLISKKIVDAGIMGSFTSAGSVIEVLLNNVQKHVENTWIDKMKKPFAMSSILQQCERAVEIKYLQVDDRPERGAQNHLEPDDEPKSIRDFYTGLKSTVRPPDPNQSNNKLSISTVTKLQKMAKNQSLQVKTLYRAGSFRGRNNFFGTTKTPNMTLQVVPTTPTSSKNGSIAGIYRKMSYSRREESHTSLPKSKSKHLRKNTDRCSDMSLLSRDSRQSRGSRRSARRSSSKQRR